MESVTIRLEAEQIVPGKVGVLIQGDAFAKERIFDALRYFESIVRQPQDLKWDLLWKDREPTEDVVIEIYGLDTPSCGCMVASLIVKEHQLGILEVRRKSEARKKAPQCCTN